MQGFAPGAGFVLQQSHSGIGSRDPALKLDSEGGFGDARGGGIGDANRMCAAVLIKVLCREMSA